MYLHANAKLGLAGRLALVRAIEDGLSLKAAAAAFSVSPATAHRWWHRWLDGGRQAGQLLLFDRSSRPRRSPRLLAAELQERICDCRRKTGWGPRLVAGATGFAHSTVWKVLRRARALAAARRAAKEPANSYEWPCPGDLLHMDVSRYARFLRPGHRVTGDRSQALARPERRDAGRLRLRARDRRRPLAARLRRAPRRREGRDRHRLRRAGARLLRRARDLAKRLMTDNAFAYVNNRSLRELLARHGIRHLTTEPYRPRTNGKVERFHQTMAREWAYGLAYRSHRQRNHALPHWLDHYNRRRPHSSLGDRPPISRVHNVRG